METETGAVRFAEEESARLAAAVTDAHLRERLTGQRLIFIYEDVLEMKRLLENARPGERAWLEDFERIYSHFKRALEGKPVMMI